jgi:hypothetical protein
MANYQNRNSSAIEHSMEEEEKFDCTYPKALRSKSSATYSAQEGIDANFNIVAAISSDLHPDEEVPRTNNSADIAQP